MIYRQADGTTQWTWRPPTTTRCSPCRAGEIGYVSQFRRPTRASARRPGGGRYRRSVPLAEAREQAAELFVGWSSRASSGTATRSCSAAASSSAST